MLREQRPDAVQKILGRYPEKRSAILPLLEIAQDIEGHVSQEAMAEIAEFVEVPLAHVLSVATFYTMFHFEPVGKHRFFVCRTLSCALAGSEELFEALRTRLGIDEGQMTTDGKCSLFAVECLGSCGTAPVMMVDRQYHESMNLEKLDRLIDELSRDGEAQG